MYFNILLGIKAVITHTLVGIAPLHYIKKSERMACLSSSEV